MKKILLIILALCGQIKAQTINLSKSHNPIQKPVIFVVDFINLDSLLISSIEFQRNDITNIRTENSKIIVTTRLLVVLDSVLLCTQKEKKVILPNVNKEKIESIEKIGKEKAMKLYGRKGKNGALLVKTKNK